MSRYKPADLERLGENARRQIELARLAMRCQDKLKAERALSVAPKRSKFGAKSYTDAEGRFHASKAEGTRWHELTLMHREGQITNLTHQPKFSLEINGVKICRYIADAEYVDADGKRVIEDTKGGKATMTAVFRIKRKLMAAILGLEITIVGT
jgi:hypothetical protein